MSDASSLTSEPKGSFGITLLAAVGGFAIFAVILLVAYVPHKVQAPGTGVLTPAQRKSALTELRGKQHTVATTYGWVDKDKGVVRLPVDRAVELFIHEHAAK